MRTAYGRDHIGEYLAESKPEFAVVMYGTNDSMSLGNLRSVNESSRVFSPASGTPIKASGDGKVVFAGTKGGYGNTVILQHGQRYTTLYAHLLRLAKGLRGGTRVKQGQVIGYVGQSGLATGPHLHYEFRVNGVHKNPLTVELPQAQPIAAEYRDDVTYQTTIDLTNPTDVPLRWGMTALVTIDTE